PCPARRPGPADRRPLGDTTGSSRNTAVAGTEFPHTCSIRPGRLQLHPARLGLFLLGRPASQDNDRRQASGLAGTRILYLYPGLRCSGRVGPALGPAQSRRLRCPRLVVLGPGDTAVLAGPAPAGFAVAALPSFPWTRGPAEPGHGPA